MTDLPARINLDQSHTAKLGEWSVVESQLKSSILVFQWDSGVLSESRLNRMAEESSIIARVEQSRCTVTSFELCMRNC